MAYFLNSVYIFMLSGPYMAMIKGYINNYLILLIYIIAQTLSNLV